MANIIKSASIGSASLNLLEMPNWSFNFNPIYSKRQGNIITQLTDRGTIGIPGSQISSNAIVVLSNNQFGSSAGAYIVTSANNRHFRCLSTSSYNFLHDGTGATLFMVIRPIINSFDGVFGNTRAAATNQIGFGIAIDNAPRELRLFIQNGSGTRASSIAYSLASATPYLVIAVTIDTDMKLWINGSLVKTDTVTTPSSSNASSNLHLWGNPGINSMEGYAYIIQGLNQVLATDFIETYSKFLFDNKGGY